MYAMKYITPYLTLNFIFVHNLDKFNVMYYLYEPKKKKKIRVIHNEIEKIKVITNEV